MKYRAYIGWWYPGNFKISNVKIYEKSYEGFPDDVMVIYTLNQLHDVLSKCDYINTFDYIQESPLSNITIFGDCIVETILVINKNQFVIGNGSVAV